MNLLTQALSQFYQIGYVTNNLQKGIEILERTFGVSKFKIFDNTTLDAIGQNNLTIDVALAMVGDINIEIIEPKQGNIDIYRRALKGEEFQLVFHHHGFNVPNGEAGWDALAKEISNSGRNFMLHGWFNNAARYGYVDYTDSFGQIFEFIAFTEEGKKIMSSLPQNNE